MNLDDFQAFCLSDSNESACIQMLLEARWPNGFQCPNCGNSRAYRTSTRRLPLFQCTACGSQTSLISGTILEGSRTPIRLWLLAIFLHSSPDGINAMQLQSLIGTTYKTAWLICHKIRHAMSHADRQRLLGNIVRINFAQYGRPYNPTVFRHPQEQPLLIGGSLNEEGHFSYIKIKQAVEECFYPQYTCPLNKHPFIRKHVSPDAEEIVAVTVKFSRTRNLRLIDLSRRASLWIHFQFRGIGPKHLQAYLDQYCFGYNITVQKVSAFHTLLSMSASAPTITYPQLIKKPNIQPRLRSQYVDLLRSA